MPDPAATPTPTPAPPAPAPPATPAPAPSAKTGLLKPVEKPAYKPPTYTGKRPPVRVEYLGPPARKVMCGNPSMPWQADIPTRHIREFWEAEQGLQFEGITFAELGLAPADSVEGKRPAFKVTKQ